METVAQLSKHPHLFHVTLKQSAALMGKVDAQLVLRHRRVDIFDSADDTVFVSNQTFLYRS
jgi:hypothetical protein